MEVRPSLSIESSWDILAAFLFIGPDRESERDETQNTLEEYHTNRQFNTVSHVRHHFVFYASDLDLFPEVVFFTVVRVTIDEIA